MASQPRGPRFVGLVTRIILGVVVLSHGAAKFGAFGGAGIGPYENVLAANDVPGPWLVAWVVAIAELFSGVFLLIGAFHRATAAVAIVTLLGSLWLESNRDFFNAGSVAGAEYTVALIAIALNVYVHGPGAVAWRVEFERTSRE